MGYRIYYLADHLCETPVHSCVCLKPGIAMNPNQHSIRSPPSFCPRILITMVTSQKHPVHLRSVWRETERWIDRETGTLPVVELIPCGVYIHIQLSCIIHKSVFFFKLPPLEEQSICIRTVTHREQTRGKRLPPSQPPALPRNPPPPNSESIQ